MYYNSVVPHHVGAATGRPAAIYAVGLHPVLRWSTWYGRRSPERRRSASSWTRPWRKYPDNDAIVYADRDYRQTWREFCDTVDRVAKGLMALGVKKGEKVAVWATNVPHWVTLQFATARIGAILLTININYKIDRDRLPPQAVRLREHLRHRWLPGHRLRQHPLRADPGAEDPAPGQAAHRAGSRTCSGCCSWARRSTAGMYSMNELHGPGGPGRSDDEYKERQSSSRAATTWSTCSTPPGPPAFPRASCSPTTTSRNNGYWIGANQNFSAERPHLPAGAAVPLLRLRAGGDGLSEPRRHHGHPGEVRPGQRHDVHREGEVHRRVRRADHVHRHPGPPAVRASSISPRCAPASWPDRPARSRSMHECVERMNMTRGDHRVRPDRVLARA